jgi:hypothetical protein
LVYLYILQPGLRNRRDIPMVVGRLFSGDVIVNDYVVPTVKCRDIPMVVRRLYSDNVIINDYVVLVHPGLRND